MSLERRLRIVNKRGLHARASAKFVETASRFDAKLTVAREGLEVDARSIMGLMMLAASCGADIVVRAEGPEAAAALAAVTALVASGFGEGA